MIPYGILITKICQRARVEFLANSSFLKPICSINTSFWNRSKGQIDGAIYLRKMVCHPRDKDIIGEGDSTSALGIVVLAQLSARFNALDAKITT